MKKRLPLKYVCSALLISLSALFFNNSASAQCNNADFSNGDFSGGWTGTWGFGTFCITQPAPNPYQNTGFNQGANNQAPNNNSPQKCHFIMTGGNDPVLSPWGYNLPVVYPGNTYSARIGNTHADGDGESLTYTFTVTANNCNFTYHYACVIEQATDLTHSTAGSQPYFNIKMVDGSNNPITCAAFEVDGSTAPTIGGFTTIPGSVTGGDPVLFKPWTSVFVPLNAYIGQTVKITFTTRSCYPCTLGICCGGSHYSYAYLAAECSPLTILSSSPYVCGSNQVTLTGPAGAATYSWSGPGIVGASNTQTCTINQAGHYTLSMTTFGDNPCTFSLDTILPAAPVNPSPNFSFTNACLGSPTSFTDLSTPAGQITAWAWDFTNSGTTQSSAQNPSYTFATAGTFPVKLSVTDVPCTVDTTINVTVTAPPTSTFTAPGPVCTGQALTVTYTGNAPVGANYTWNFDGGTVNSGSGQGPYSISWATAGTKNVTLSVTNSGCSSTQTTVPVTVNTTPSVTVNTPTPICGGGNTTLTATPNPSGGTYSWSPGGASTVSVTVSPATTTTYTVTYSTGTCGNATATATVNVSQIPNVTVTTTDPGCNSPLYGSAVATGSNGISPYQYSLNGAGNQSSGNFNNLISGSYTVVATDNAGCQSTPANFTINSYTPVTLALVIDSSGCTNGSGQIIANASGGTGPYQYSINGGAYQASGTFSSVQPGSVTINTQDATNCVVSQTVIMPAKPVMSLSLATTDAICAGTASGQIIATVSNGVSPYQYAYNGGIPQNSNTLSGLTAGAYTVTATDVNGCSTTASTAVNEPSPLIISALSVTAVKCIGDQNGTATLSLSGGTPPYSFSCTKDGFNFVYAVGNVVSGLDTGEYEITLSDAKGCTVLSQLTVPNAVPDSFTVNTTPTSCFGGQVKDGAISLTGAPLQNAPFSFSLNSGNFLRTDTFTGLDTGTYHIAAMNQYGCITNLPDATIGEPSSSAVSILPNDTTLNLGQSVQLETYVTVSPAPVTLAYQWSPLEGLSCYDCGNPVATPYAPENVYTVTVTMNGLCTLSASATIMVLQDVNVFVPSSFSPNGDGNNDLFYIYGKNIKQLNLKVYNRWGEKVFESNGQYIGWDGTYKGVVQPEGVYVYETNIVFLNNKTFFKSGSLTLVR
ncbi:MAG TPA: gliding motility-associated C-terminal domain-containing protein [Chitinophagales bacterium]|nr:gliding motility-associated C-terminal domain-containing protein [Chitinophagales bacterium]